jgi:hypothetical protein
MLRRRRMFQPNPLTTDQLAVLVRANQLLSEGQPLMAAPLFTQLAGAMKQSNHPRRAANLYTRAAHAFADGNDAPPALAYSKAALELFIQYKLAGRAATFFGNITRKLTAKGMVTAAEALQREFGAQVAALPVGAGPQRVAQPHRGLLPTACPKCGAPLHSEDVTWVDENTIECEYCGAYIRSEA